MNDVKSFFGQKGMIQILPLLVIIGAVGIILFLIISSTAPNGGFFGILNPKPKSHAATPVGVWTDVTPVNITIGSDLPCGNFGITSVFNDPLRPSDFYAEANCQGIWKSTDYGQSWIGPINSGFNGGSVSGCACDLAIAPNVAGKPIIYAVDVRGFSGNWKSVDGGVNWSPIIVSPAPSGRNDFGWISIDPYDPNHLMITGHEQDTLFQSIDAGATWTGGIFPAGGIGSGGTAGFFFIDTGNPATTRNTWLWIAQAAGGTFGTWRTTNGGISWTRVDNNEKPHGGEQLYQPGNGVIYMPGLNSALGSGVLRSSDYGQTWAHVGSNTPEAVMIGTPNNIYAQYGWACQFCIIDPDYQIASQPGITNWNAPGGPVGMNMGADTAATAFDGSNYIIVTANFNSGIWRYVEPSGNPPPTSTPIPVGPTVAISSPVNNQIVSGSITINITISSDVTNSQVFVDNILKHTIGTATSTPLDTTTLTNGNHTLKVVSTNASQLTAQTSIVINVQNVVITPTPTISPTPVPTTSPACLKASLGDTDCNGLINIFDYNLVVTNFGKVGTGIQGDIDKNGIVNIFDYNILVTNFGK